MTQQTKTEENNQNMKKRNETNETKRKERRINCPTSRTYSWYRVVSRTKKLPNFSKK